MNNISAHILHHVSACVSHVITSVMLAGLASVMLRCAAAMHLLHVCPRHFFKVLLYLMQEELCTPSMLHFTQQLRLGGTAASLAVDSRSTSFLGPLFCGQYQSCLQCACGYHSNRSEPIEDVSLTLPPKSSTLPDGLCPFTVKVC